MLYPPFNLTRTIRCPRSAKFPPTVLIHILLEARGQEAGVFPVTKEISSKSGRFNFHGPGRQFYRSSRPFGLNDENSRA